MQRWRFWAAIILGLAAAPAAAQAAECDENNPNGPMRVGQVTLTANDAVNDQRTELRSFVDTGSLGRVEATIAGATPPGIVRHFSAAPHLSRLSPGFGERLKGIQVAATLSGGDRSARIVIRLRQVCAERFRDSFLNE